MAWRATARRSLARLLAAGWLCAPGATALAQPSDPVAPEPPGLEAPRTPADWETLSAGLPEEARLRLRPGFVYNRVDGATPVIGVALQSEQAAAPFLYAGAAYATGRDRGLGAAGFELPVGDPTWLRAGGDLYRRTASEDVWIVGEAENSLFALFARTDYRDYYEAEGVAGRLIWEPGRDAALEVGVRFESERSLRTRVRFSVLGKDDRFRDNPPILPGDEGLLALSARVGPLRLPLRGGTRVLVRYEHAGGALGRDFEYGRIRAAAHTLVRLSKRHAFRVRGIVGSTREGTLPPQRIWHVGGIGTLRAHDYKAFSGDQFFVANGEYMVRVRRAIFPFAFLDWGAAWFGTDLDAARPGLDGGLGIKLGEDLVALTLARDLQRSDGPIRIGFRLGGSF